MLFLKNCSVTFGVLNKSQLTVSSLISYVNIPGGLTVKVKVPSN
jgi:hypothetical protein